MIIAHLSDMHVGSQFQPDVFDVLLEEINSIKPDAVVITGDLTNQGLVKEFEECKRLISRFKTKKLITMSASPLQSTAITITGIQDICYSKNTFHSIT